MHPFDKDFNTLNFCDVIVMRSDDLYFINIFARNNYNLFFIVTCPPSSDGVTQLINTEDAGIAEIDRTDV